ncbi:hypothetical protein KM043_000180 [Ampulex compressa]|nr:hypothetical protein KM043_000180 [Ampulex compressa]
MPQGRRKAPFSGKAKKQQMQAKKQNRALLAHYRCKNDDNQQGCADLGEKSDVQEINKQPKNVRSSRDRYALRFFRESKEELQKRKEQARTAIELLSLEQQEFSDDYFPTGLNMPKRPPWNFNMTREELDLREQRYFTEYLKRTEQFPNIGHFELNLETWRQLWRVLEMSDILLFIIDIRYPVLMFPPYLYDHVTNELRKDMIVILNKIDLAPPPLVVAWKSYFCNAYPKLRVLMFTSYPLYNLHGNTDTNTGMKSRRRKGKLRMAAEGSQKLLDACKDIVKDKVDLNSWYEKIQEEINSEYDLDDIDRKSNIVVEEQDTTYFEHERYKNGVLTIGCIGNPNVGKSSLMNALMGKKVVSVSRTPGHTKHFQTIFITKSVCLCDCPAQVSEPYTTVKFLAERIELAKLLNIRHPDNDDTWSAMDICDGWAAKKNYVTARAARPDSYRAANSLLRMALEGKICIYVYPPHWATDKDTWAAHADVEEVRWIQARTKTEDRTEVTSFYASSEDEEDQVEAETERDQKGSGSDESDYSECESSDAPSVVNKFAALSTENERD